MARISFDAVQTTAADGVGTSNDGIKFFSLKNNGDTAIVRIMHNSVEDFDIMTTHQIELGGKYRKISCIRNPHEPVDVCPLCATGSKLQQRFFVHMIQYVPDASGQIAAQPVVWERSAGEYAPKLKNLIEEYGPLSDVLFKIKRNGEPRSMDTTYELMYAPPATYPDSAYPKVEDAFKDYTALGRVVLEKDYNEIVHFMSNGSFPAKEGNTAATNTTSVPAGVVTPAVVEAPTTGGYVPNGTGAAPAQPFNAPTTGERMPWEAPSADTAANRPVRRY